MDAAHILFPDDAPKAQSEAPSGGASAPGGAVPGAGAPGQPAAPAGKGDGQDVAAILFKDDAAHFDERPVRDFISGFATSAIADGNTDRARALEAAGDALVEDAKANGTSAGDLREALAIVHERSDILGSITPEAATRAFDRGMTTLQAEGFTMADIDAARALIRDIEARAPGTMDTLERTGSGSDPRLIRKVIAEAKRRGYR